MSNKYVASKDKQSLIADLDGIKRRLKLIEITAHLIQQNVKLEKRLVSLETKVNLLTAIIEP